MAQNSEKRGSPAHSWAQEDHAGQMLGHQAAGSSLQRPLLPQRAAVCSSASIFSWSHLLYSWAFSSLLQMYVSPGPFDRSVLSHLPCPTLFSYLPLIPSQCLLPAPLHPLSLQPHLEPEVSPWWCECLSKKVNSWMSGTSKSQTHHPLLCCHRRLLYLPQTLLGRSKSASGSGRRGRRRENREVRGGLFLAEGSCRVLSKAHLISPGRKQPARGALSSDMVGTLLPQ